ncbi:hypothetical protein RESH_02381 [Rhodopirellula europaea SH398]|uniref:Uncharacterized protein n=1 Tax=Rhodopirellula europaea SH398 TaxID=1263868 RepID=M5SH81_9BACT|nr:hypothetical protein RESH_02381 [Rhodopirellula europaea SH398]
MGCPAAIITLGEVKSHDSERGSAHLKSIHPSRVFTRQQFVGHRSD